jgi:glutamate-1-semialdehyde 2,1-aminomutase
MTVSARDQMGLRMLVAGNAGLQSVVEKIAARQPKSQAWQARADAALSGTPSLLPYEAPLLPICVESASGARLRDVDGNEYVDAHMAYTAGVLGHRPPQVAQAVAEALGRGLEGGHLFREQVELGELVLRMVPGAERVALFHTGGEAVAAAVRMARSVTGRSRFAKFEGCYHGSNEVGLHNTWMILSGRPPGEPGAEIPPHAATGGLRTDPTVLVLPFNEEAAFERLREHAKDLACVVVDPVPPFMSNWPDDCRTFVRRLLEVAKEADVPVVFDEVVCGFRLAKGGAREWLGAAPQMSCFGKITSGLGIPLSMVAGEARFLDAMRTAGLWRDYMPPRAWLSSTLQANFPAVAAALAQMRLVEEKHEELMARLDRNHALLREQLAEVAERTGIPVAVQGHPRLQMQFSVGKAEPASRTFAGVMSSTSPAMMRTLMAVPLYLRLEGVYTKVIPTLNLSTAHTDDDVLAVAAALERAVVQARTDGIIAA